MLSGPRFSLPVTSMVLAQEAKEAAATRRKEQTDRCSFTAKRIKDKIKNSQDKEIFPSILAVGVRTPARRQ